MEGYNNSTYGDAFADIYDDWYRGISDVGATVDDLIELADGKPILELGVGTGRLAIPLAEAARAHGVLVTGIDSSEAMLSVLARNDPDGHVESIQGDMIDDLPAGPFGLVFVAYNTLFNLEAPGQQQRCFDAVSSRLTPAGRFVVEAFVPDEPFRSGDDVSVRSLDAESVVLSVSRHNPTEQRADGQFVEFTESGGVRLRPWSIRYSTIVQLDAMANASGFVLEHRWQSFGRSEFDSESNRHVSVFRLI